MVIYDRLSTQRKGGKLIQNDQNLSFPCSSSNSANIDFEAYINIKIEYVFKPIPAAEGNALRTILPNVKSNEQSRTICSFLLTQSRRNFFMSKALLPGFTIVLITSQYPILTKYLYP